jgi:hypothetical protein
MPAGTRILLSTRRIATPAALDAAFRRRIDVAYEEPGAAGPARVNTVNDSALLSKLRARDGTYVVVVKNGQLTISTIGAEGPKPFAQT